MEKQFRSYTNFDGFPRESGAKLFKLYFGSPLVGILALQEKMKAFENRRNFSE